MKMLFSYFFDIPKVIDTPNVFVRLDYSQRKELTKWEDF